MDCYRIDPNCMHMKLLNATTAFLFGIFTGLAASFVFNNEGRFDQVYLIAFIAIASAMISIFIDFLIAPKQIFGFWSNVLKRIEASPFKVLAKPLGTCIYCQNVYVYSACFFAVYFNTTLSLWLFIGGAACSHVALAFLDKQLNS